MCQRGHLQPRDSWGRGSCTLYISRINTSNTIKEGQKIGFLRLVLQFCVYKISCGLLLGWRTLLPWIRSPSLLLLLYLLVFIFFGSKWNLDRIKFSVCFWRFCILFWFLDNLKPTIFWKHPVVEGILSCPTENSRKEGKKYVW